MLAIIYKRSFLNTQPSEPAASLHGQLEGKKIRRDLKMGLKVFLCQASNDKQRVRQLYNKLQAHGCRPWLDEEELIAGQDWQLEIPKAVRAAHVVVVCLSQ